MPLIKVLVVEDNAVARFDIQVALQKAGFEVVGEAATGEDALELAEALNPSIVLMDIQLEGTMGGVVAADTIYKRYDIPVIFLTAYADDETLHSAKITEPYGYLLKPVDHRELKTSIEVGLYKHEMERQLRRAKLEAESANRAKTSFLATISHELRTPMNGVLGMTELLLLSDLDDPYRENVQLIKDSALSLLSVLNQIIDYSKLEASILKARDMDFKLEDLIAGVLSQYERSAISKGIKLDYTISPKLPEWVRGDSGKIRQVFSNLVNNAVKFTKMGMVIVDVSPATALGASDTLSVQILVQDTGSGIPKEKVSQVFDSFSLGEDYLSHSSGGLGLGLAIVNKLVEVLGGTIECHSEEGKGSRFTVTLPLEHSKYEIETPIVAVMADEKPLQGARVLVAEDDLVNQRYIVRLLEKMGCEVVLAENGLYVVDALKSEHFDIVLMDIEMPVMNGIEATRAIREQVTGCLDPQIPIVALTAHAMWGDEQRCIHAGMDDYLAKPVDINSLAAIIQSTLDK